MIEPDAIALAQAVASRKRSATAVIDAALACIHQRDTVCNAFTSVLAERARARADELDRSLQRGDPVGPLAGVPFAVKNLFDLEGVTTLAGSKVLAADPPAQRDAVLVERLERAGAVVVGALNMDEFAYGFTTENSHAGPCRNPHDPSCIAGGSSGGSGAAVAAGMVPLALGSDTNGSIRVPASLCGVFGLKPTFGRLSRRGSFPFVASLDHLGPFARSVRDLAVSYDVMQGPDPKDPACANRPVEPTAAQLERPVTGLRIARLGGYFETHAGPQALAALDLVCEALGVMQRIELPMAAQGRAAAFIVTASEGGSLHAQRLRDRYSDYEPLSRDRFVAGSLIPAAWYLRAQRVRAAYRQRVAEVFGRFDILLAPATPVAAPTIGTEWLEINGQRLPARASMGILTQPISSIGLPVVCVPVRTGQRLPLGVQVIAAPWQEAQALRVAAELERRAVVAAPVAPVEPVDPGTEARA